MAACLCRWKDRIVKLGAYILFYSRILEAISRLARRVRFYQSDGRASRFPTLLSRTPRNVQILTYHRINDDADPFFPSIPAQVFACQMEYVASAFNVLSLEDIVERLRTGDIPDNAIVITFDDGYRDNYTQAFPILKKLSMPATIFLATDVIGTQLVLWHDRVFSAFRETRNSLLLEYGRVPRDYRLSTLPEKLDAQQQVLSFLRSMDNEERRWWVDRLEERLGITRNPGASDLMLSWDDVKVMHQAGITFGSHTVNHSILSKEPLAWAKMEIRESKALIEQQLGVSVRTFAYPNGTKEDFSQNTKELLREAGYTCAVTTIFGANTRDLDPFELRRGGPWELHLPTFAMKLHWYKLAASFQ